MIKSADLFSIATSGLNASNRLLDTASNNIANVNTEGYVRERTTFTSQLSGGVDGGVTERIISTFAQNQLRRDTTQLGEYTAYYNNASRLDDLLASEANGLSTGMSRFFSAIQTANDDPTNRAARSLVIGEAENLLSQMTSLDSFMAVREKELNLEMDALIDRANSLISTIAELNNSIKTVRGANRDEVPGALMNERDSAILELASLVSIETRPSGNNDGSVLVNLTSGESLVLQDGSFNAFQQSGDPDLNFKTLQLRSSGKPTTINLDEGNVGGELGGLYRYRNEILAPNRRELGQLAFSFAEEINRQNRLGMDLDQQLGSNLFRLPEFQSLNYADNSDATLIVNGRIEEGEGNQITSADLQITIDAVTAGAPPTVDITVALLNADGSQVLDANGTAITQTYTGVDAASGSFTPVLGGVEIELPDGTGYAVGDQFLLQPTRNTIDKLAMATTRPEDLAMASPLRIDPSLNNLGDAALIGTSVTNTTVDNTFADSAASAFNGSGGIHGPGAAPGGGVGAPAEIRFTAADEFEVRDSAGTVITTVSGVTNLNNLMSQAAATGGWPAAFSGLDNYPGFDFSLQGSPRAGDSFSIGYNTDGLDDNRNGLGLSALHEQATVLSSNNGSTARVSFFEAYADIVGEVGEKTASAEISLRASEAMEVQSRDWFESISGVSLDEEAANLVRYQQTYAAAARILTTARELFDTILAAAR
ncbi:flagellar hook-associated protein FlgK [Aestuariibacter salexigens]|uniref:flagellar hook-associated protein FlgK n=1 Tax=Aestuariibacter salexigens TaxID=226010 RepID=UPI0003F7FE94|nr:flagellar hook-associated protein FlgK [Aestuariibacter salexigens]